MQTRLTGQHGRLPHVQVALYKLYPIVIYKKYVNVALYKLFSYI